VNIYENTVKHLIGAVTYFISFTSFASLIVILKSENIALKVAAFFSMLSIYGVGIIFMQSGGNIYLWSKDVTLYNKNEVNIDVKERKFLIRVARSLKPVCVAMSNFHFMSRETAMKLKDIVLQQTVAFVMV